MTNIILFGATTSTGKYIKNNHKRIIQKSTLFCFSRNRNSNLFLDLTNYDFPNEIPKNKDLIIISLAPIWLFVPYLESIFNKRYIKCKYIKGIIVTSSTSVITKKYSWNKFDKDLHSKLLSCEKRLINLNKRNNLKITIMRPTLIYDDIGSNLDKNLSVLTSIMKKTYLLPIPYDSGLRQPIHISQFGESILNISKSYINDKCENGTKIINIGGDEELSYQEILNRIKENCLSKDSIQNCNLIKIPNRIFFLICIPIIIFSPKLYEALLRISVNMNGFTKSYKISGIKKQMFPIKSIK